VFKIVARDNVRALANRAFVSAIQICSAIAGRDGIVGNDFAIAHLRLAPATGRYRPSRRAPADGRGAHRIPSRVEQRVSNE
jgi:hypothetical protein